MKLFRCIFILLIVSCGQDQKSQESNADTDLVTKPKYAKGFDWEDHNQFRILNIYSPWPDSDKTYNYILVNRTQAAAMAFGRDAYDGIILTPVERIVVTSTTHLPPLEMLGKTESLVGFPGTDYISSSTFRKNIEENRVKELGKNESINTEVLLELNPEVLVGFGVNGANKTFDLIERSGTPVIYNGDWVESSPLAKAEWIKFFGLLFEETDMADSIFNKIESDYLNAKNLIPKNAKPPTALSGALHKDVWYLPGGNSTEAQFFEDAAIDYIWSNTEKKGSLSFSLESVLEKAQNAELWFSPSYYRSKEELINANEHYKEFKAFQEDRIYSFVNKTGQTGGVLYYELGVSRPDLVLKDLINIAYPGVLPNYEAHFFEPLK